MMKEKGKILKWVFTLLLCGLGVACRDNPGHPNNSFHVEIAPKCWLRVEEKQGRAWFQCEWKGKKIFWGGDYRDGVDKELPVCLRSWKDTLYLVVHWVENPRSDPRARYKYLKLNHAGTGFEEIPRQDFPKQIATENMHPLSVARREMNYWDLIRKLDYKNSSFWHTSTAAMWLDLEKQITDLEAGGTMSNKELMDFFAGYIAKYKPIVLPTIVDESDLK